MSTIPLQTAARKSNGFRAALALMALAAWACHAAPAQTAEAPSASQPATTDQAAEPHYWLRVTGERVNIRSRADLNSRIVGRAERDDVLEGVGSEYGWHRIVPPEGVHSLVGAAFIERTDEQHGVVSVDTTLRVRVGSDIMPRDPLKSEVHARLPRGSEVQIVGELDEEWLKIVPPEGVYVYVSDEFTERISEEVANRLRPARPVAVADSIAAEAPQGELPEGAEATTQPVEPPELTGAWGQRLGGVLDAIEEQEQKPLGEQHWDEILGHLGPIASQRVEPQVAEYAAAWVRQLEQRKAQQAVAGEARAIARQTEEGKARHTRELADIRRARSELKPTAGFDARGVLRPSFALPPGPSGMRYKVQDPFTHKVQAYLEFPTELGIDARAAIGKYVGVRGERLSLEGIEVSVLRVTRLTVLNPDKAESPTTREKP